MSNGKRIVKHLAFGAGLGVSVGAALAPDGKELEHAGRNAALGTVGWVAVVGAANRRFGDSTHEAENDWRSGEDERIKKEMDRRQEERER